MMLVLARITKPPTTRGVGADLGTENAANGFSFANSNIEAASRGDELLIYSSHAGAVCNSSRILSCTSSSQGEKQQVPCKPTQSHIKVCKKHLVQGLL